VTVFRSKKAIFLAVVAVATASGALVRSSSFGRFLELKSYDYRFAFRSSGSGDETPITILAIDEPSLDRIPEPLMLWHKHIAALIRGLAEAKAKVIGIDLILSDITSIDPAGQEELARSILQAGGAGTKLVLGYRIRESGVEQPPDSIRFAALAAGHAFAYLNLTTDIDDFVRRQQLSTRAPDGSEAPGFSLAVESAFHRPKRNDSDYVLINYREPGHFAQESFYKALGAANDHRQAYLNERFAGRIVLISRVGSRAEEDLHSTPHYYWQTSSPRSTGRRTPGVEVHANTIWTLLNDKPIRPVTAATQNIINFAVVVLVTLCCTIWRPVRATAATMAILAVTFYISFVFVFHYDVWADVVSPEVAGLVAFGFTETANYMFEGREKRRLRRIFGGYVDDKVITRILDNSDRVLLEGTRKAVAVLFADIKGFTTRSEVTPPERVVHMLNEYFAEIIAAIQDHEGLVNSLMGDGLMAIFGAPLDDPRAANHAIGAAKAMMAALARVNQRLKDEGVAPIDIGIGIHFGEAVVGNMGSPRKMEYTAIGDVVNTAARVEGLTRKTEASILMTADAFAAAGSPADARYIGDFEVKGRAAKVSIYCV
jgi:adenylate cyclase